MDGTVALVARSCSPGNIGTARDGVARGEQPSRKQENCTKPHEATKRESLLRRQRKDGGGGRQSSSSSRERRYNARVVGEHTRAADKSASNAASLHKAAWRRGPLMCSE